MYSTVFLAIFSLFYLQYNTSKKVSFGRRPPYLIYLSAHSGLTHALCLGLAVATLAALIILLGAGSGIFGFIVMLMAAGTLIVSVTPLRMLRARHVAALYAVLLALEVFIF
ncbi:hypothetical protein [Parapedobacter sp. DT-150]|uniref:hypothetical protein n=1 Tax=Parapedobacter sp. DT-150 TaxID=3396162 RepID=UPI003F1D9D1F